MFVRGRTSGACSSPLLYPTSREDRNVSRTSSLAGWDWIQDYQSPSSVSVGEFMSSPTAQVSWPDPRGSYPTYRSSLTQATLPGPVQANASLPVEQPFTYNLDPMVYMCQDVAASPPPGGTNDLEFAWARRPTQSGASASSHDLELDTTNGEESLRRLRDMGEPIITMERRLRTDARRSGGEAFRSTPTYVLRRMAQDVKDELRRRAGGSSTISVVPEITAQMEAPGFSALQKHQVPLAVHAGCPFDEGCTTALDTYTLKDLRAHQRACHAGSNSTMCRWHVGHRYCSKIFKSTGGLMKHIGQVHLKCNLVQCPTCGETFARSDALARHLKGTCATPNPPGGTNMNV